MNHVKQKVYIVVSYPLNSEECRIQKVFGTLESAQRFSARLNSQKKIGTLHIVKKSVEGTTFHKFTDEYNDSGNLVSIHRGVKNARSSQIS